MSKIKNVLPSTLHGLLKVAIDDLKKAVKNEHIALNMSTWHSANLYFKKGVKCVCCMAGSVMRYALNTNINKTYSPHDFSADIQKKLYAINDMRLLNFREAFDELYDHCKGSIYDNDMFEFFFGESFLKFHRDTIEKYTKLHKCDRGTIIHNPQKFIELYSVFQKRLESLNI